MLKSEENSMSELNVFKDFLSFRNKKEDFIKAENRKKIWDVLFQIISLPFLSSLLTSLQDVPYECLGSQSQVWQLRPLAMFQVSGAQRSQCWPTTLGRQWHWPLLPSQWQSPDDGQLEGSLPSWLQTHSVDKNQSPSRFIKIFLKRLIQEVNLEFRLSRFRAIKI